MTPNPLLTTFVDDRRASRIWAREPTAFLAKPSPDAVSSIGQRLGWLDAPAGMAAHVADLTAFAAEARRDRLTHVYLLGMGGSSLCAEVLRDVPLVRDGETRADGPRHDRRAHDPRGHRRARPRAVALHRRQQERRHDRSDVARAAFLGRDVGDAAASSPARTSSRSPIPIRRSSRTPRRGNTGGRSSTRRTSAAATRRCRCSGWCRQRCWASTSPRCCESAATMAGDCRADSDDNPGLALGAFLAQHASAGRDKLTVILPPLARAARRVDRAAGRGKHGQERPRHPAGRRRADRHAERVRKGSRDRRR